MDSGRRRPGPGAPLPGLPPRSARHRRRSARDDAGAARHLIDALAVDWPEQHRDTDTDVLRDAIQQKIEGISG